MERKPTDGYMVLEEIKGRLDLTGYALKLFPDLTKQGSRYQGGHEGIHPSQNNRCLVIYPEGNWYCFHCGRGGDIFSLIGVQQFGTSYSGRGSQFKAVLEIAAREVGVELKAGQSGEYAAWEEQNRLFNLLTETARWWHRQLVDKQPDMLDWLLTTYGFKTEFIERKLIGFAPPVDNRELLKHLLSLGFSETECKAAAVVNRGGYGRFRGRVTFPYWWQGQVRYFAARKTEYTPEEEAAAGKYLKLKTRDSDHPHISPFIQNDLFFGLDTLRQALKLGRVLITEGIPDQLAAEQSGEPCLTPATIRLKAGEVEILADLVREIPEVYLCMDSEESGAGEKGAMETARALEEKGVAVKILALPRPEWVAKIDVCDFIREEGPHRFKTLYLGALRLPHFLATNDNPGGNPYRYIKTLAEFSTLCRYNPLEEEELQQLVARRLKIRIGLVSRIFREVTIRDISGRVPVTEPDRIKVTIPGLEIQKLEKITSDPPRYLLYLSGQERAISLTIDELLDFTAFRNKIAAVANLVILHPRPPDKYTGKADTWGMAVGTLLQRVVEVAAPEDASEEYNIQQKILHFFRGAERRTQERSGIELGRVWQDEKTGTLWCKGAGIIQGYLKVYLDKPPEAAELWKIFQNMGGFSKVLKVDRERTIRCWCLKLEEPAANEKEAG